MSQVRPHEDTTVQPQPAALPGGRWIVVAAGVATGLLALWGSGEDGGVSVELPLTAVAIAVICYLAAAASGIRWMAWVCVPAGSAWLCLPESSTRRNGRC